MLTEENKEKAKPPQQTASVCIQNPIVTDKV